jgi:hypothetical protein
MMRAFRKLIEGSWRDETVVVDARAPGPGCLRRTTRRGEIGARYICIRRDR